MVNFVAEPYLGETVLLVLQIAALIYAAATLLSLKKPKLASLDDALQSSATQGAYIPLVIGRARIGPVFCFVEDATSTAQATLLPQQRSLIPGVESLLGLPGGFGKGGGGVGAPPGYKENALHVICVGPATELRAIYQNGKKIWEGPINPGSHASGSQLSAGVEGTFQVYWGFPDDPVLSILGASPAHGLGVKYAYALKILWLPKELGQSRQWPRLEYEVICPCYSQIAGSPSLIPLEGDDAHPTFEEWSSADAYVPVNNQVTDRLEFDITGWNAAKRELIIGDIRIMGSSGIPLQADLSSLYAPGSIVKVWRPSAASPAYRTVGPDPSWGDAINGSQGPITNDVWRYYWIVNSRHISSNWPSGNYIEIPPSSGTFIFMNRYTVLTLGPEVPQDQLKNVENSSVPATLIINGTLIGTAIPVSVANSDGVNPIHIVDQVLFAKYPYGSGKDRSKFDSRSIEIAAEIMQKEKIRGTLAIRDGEGSESSLAAIMQDIGLMIPWDPIIGKNVFRLLRYEEATANIPPEAILSAPSMDAIQGTRPVDVIAFTFKDRERNYREAPLRVMDSGQVTLYETQKAQKVPIEITNDRDSVARIAPRRQQEVLANLAVLTFETNHATQIAMPGERFTATETEGPGLQFILTEIKRDINSSKVVLGSILDTYNQQPSTSQRALTLTPMDSPKAGKTLKPVNPLAAFLAFEVPRVLASGNVSLFFGCGRSSPLTQSSLVWGSRDGIQFAIVGTAPIVISGVLFDELHADSPCYDDGDHLVTPDYMPDFLSTADLSLDEDGWRSGQQIMLIGSEIVFLRSTGTSFTEGVLSGLIRGRAGTRQQFHGEGTPFFIFSPLMVQPIESASFVPGNEIYYKAQAVEKSSADDIGSIDAKSIVLQGLAYTPLPPTGLRQASLQETYDVAETVRLDWCYYSDEFKMTGLGTQGFGTVSGQSKPKGFFRVEIVGITSFDTTDPFIELSVLQRATYGLDGLSSWTVNVTHFEGSFSSSAATLTLTPA